MKIPNFLHSVTIRGDTNEEAVLCTHTGSYEIKAADTSNVLFLLPTILTPKSAGRFFCLTFYIPLTLKFVLNLNDQRYLTQTLPYFIFIDQEIFLIRRKDYVFIGCTH